MRGILFRGKRIDNGEWVEGYYCKMSETTYAFAEDYERNPVPIHHFIAREIMSDWGLPNRMILIEVDPSTVCQCTCKTDADKNLIFEHDVISFLDAYSTESGYAELWCIGEVTWDEETLSFQVTERLSAESYEVLDECKVLGNTIDNPELLEGGAE